MSLKDIPKYMRKTDVDMKKIKKLNKQLKESERRFRKLGLKEVPASKYLQIKLSHEETEVVYWALRCLIDSSTGGTFPEKDMKTLGEIVADFESYLLYNDIIDISQSTQSEVLD